MSTITTIPTTRILNFNIDELTTGELKGNGAFDILMKTLKAHLWNEYENERIRGTDYANSYVNLLNNALGQITDYALDKSKLPLELKQMEADIHKTASETILITKQGGLVDAQIHSTMKDVELKEFELKFIKPIELKLKEKELEIKEKHLILAEKDIALKEKELDIKDKELIIKEKQIAITQYELEHKLPAEVANTKAQTDLYVQKTITEKAQTDPSVIIDGSVISHNNKVLAEQARSYDNDGKIKLTSILVDSWKVRRNDDPDATLADDINKLHDPMIGKLIETLSVSVGVID